MFIFNWIEVHKMISARSIERKSFFGSRPKPFLTIYFESSYNIS